MKHDPTRDKAIDVTVFKAQCLSLIEDVAQGKVRRVLLMRHDRPVAAIVPIEHEIVELWGAMRGAVTVVLGTDLTAPSGEAWKAEA